jgi:hypothetical protein
VVGDEPTIIIIDEIAQHLRQLASSGNAEVRRMADAVPVFLKNLFELAAGNPNTVVILTLATRQDAFGKETDELAELLNEFDGEHAFKETESIVARFTTGSSIVKPAADQEIAEILKRRLFKRVDRLPADSAFMVRPPSASTSPRRKRPGPLPKPIAPCGLTWSVPASRACDPTAAGTPSPRASARAEPTPPRSRPCSDTHPSTQRPGTSAPDQPRTPPSSSAYSTTDQPTTSESPRCLSTHIRTRVGGNAAAHSPLTPETVPLWAKPRPGMGEP